MPALDLVSAWPVGTAAAGYAGPVGVPVLAGDPDHRFALASVTKLLTTVAVLVAVEEGTVALDEPAGDVVGVTLRHLLAHTSGLPFDGTTPLARPGRQRIYSNVGIERAAAHVAARSAMPFATYLDEAVLQPLGMTATSLGDRSPAAGGVASLRDLLAFGQELLRPTLLDPATVTEATTVQFPGLAGVVPGIGRMDPCDWGLGFEIRDGKSPHWTGADNSPATHGHFGGAGTFLWIDPGAGDGGVVCCALTDEPFDAWALACWPVLADAVVAETRPRP